MEVQPPKERYHKVENVVGNGLYKLWLQQGLCDVEVHTKDGVVKCHKVVLSTHSPFLAKIFSQAPREDVVSIGLTDYRLSSVQVILTYMYTNEVAFNMNNISELIAIGKKLELLALLEEASSFLVKTCDNENVVFYFSVALNSKLRDAVQVLFNIIVDNFGLVSKSSHFLYLSAERLEPFLKCTNINVSCEAEVFRVLVNWANFDRCNRISEANYLMKYIYFNDISTEDLVKEIETSKWLLTECSSIRDIIFEVLKTKKTECCAACDLRCCEPCCNNPCSNPCPNPCSNPCPNPCPKPFSNPCCQPCYPIQNCSDISECFQNECYMARCFNNRYTNDIRILNTEMNLDECFYKEAKSEPTKDNTDFLDRHYNRFKEICGAQTTKHPEKPAPKKSYFTKPSIKEPEADEDSSKDDANKVTLKIPVSHTKPQKFHKMRRDTGAAVKDKEALDAWREQKLKELRQNYKANSDYNVKKQKNKLKMNSIEDRALSEDSIGSSSGKEGNKRLHLNKGSQTNTSKDDTNKHKNNKGPRKNNNNRPYFGRHSFDKNDYKVRLYEDPEMRFSREDENGLGFNGEQIKWNQDQNNSSQNSLSPIHDDQLQRRHHRRYYHAHKTHRPKNPHHSGRRRQRSHSRRHRRPKSGESRKVHGGYPRHRQSRNNNRYRSDDSSYTEKQSTSNTWLSEFRTLTDTDYTTPPLNISNNSKSYLLVVGGINFNNNSMQSYEKSLIAVNTNDWQMGWSRLTLKLKYLVHHHQIAVLNGKLYVVGGALYSSHMSYKLGEATDTLSILDFGTGCWRFGAVMITPRAYFSMCVWRKKLIIITGEIDSNVETDGIDIYNTMNDRWDHLTAHPGGPRLGVASAVLTDKLYVVGGYSQCDKGRSEIMDDAFYYDLLTNQWSILNYLHKPVSHASLVVINYRKLLLIGGRTISDDQESYSTDDIYTFDEALNEWILVGKLTSPRHDMSATVLESSPLTTEVFLIGGMETPNPMSVNTVERIRYDQKHQKTRVTLFPGLPVAVTGTACCVTK